MHRNLSFHTPVRDGTWSEGDRTVRGSLHRNPSFTKGPLSLSSEVRERENDP